jgi:hypothetical protein
VGKVLAGLFAAFGWLVGGAVALIVWPVASFSAAAVVFGGSVLLCVLTAIWLGWKVGSSVTACAALAYFLSVPIGVGVALVLLGTVGLSAFLVALGVTVLVVVLPPILGAVFGVQVFKELRKSGRATLAQARGKSGGSLLDQAQANLGNVDFDEIGGYPGFGDSRRRGER